MIVNLKEAYYSYDRLRSDADQLARKYDSILQCVTIGRSHDNRDIILLKLGIGQQHILCCGGVHGRETINPIVLLSMVEYYADLYMNYQQQRSNLLLKLKVPMHNLETEYEELLYGTCIYELLQTFTILFVPLLNPDGYMIALEGFDTIQDPFLRDRCQDMKIPPKEWKFNGRAVDLNRNFPSKLWRSKFPQDQPASENETKALISLFRRYRTKGFLDFHSRGKEIYYYRSIMPTSYNERQLIIANRLKEITNYELVPPQDEVEAGDTGGNTVHYYSENFAMPALTIETLEETEEFPLRMELRQPTFEELKLVIVEFARMVI